MLTRRKCALACKYTYTGVNTGEGVAEDVIRPNIMIFVFFYFDKYNAVF